MNRIDLEGIICRSYDYLALFLMGCCGIFFVAPVHANTCGYNYWADPINFEIKLPANLMVPRDTPIGGVLLEYELTAPYRVEYTCSGAKFISGIENQVGGSASSERKTDFPIGNTGLAWSLATSNGTEIPDITMGLVSTGLGNRYHWLEGSGYIVKIKKIGRIKEGAKIPAGLLGRYSVDRQLYPVTIRALTQSSIGTGSCKTPDVTVKMGDQNNVGQFKGVGTSLEPVSFSIALRECPQGINRVWYQLKPNTEVVDAGRSVVAFDAQSTARGVGLQLLNNNGDPLQLMSWLPFREYDKAGGSFDIPLKAAYQQTAPVVVPGTANTSVTLVMSYD